LMNSLKFNEVDWTVVVKKVDEETRIERAKKVEESRIEAAKKAEEARIDAQEKEEADKIAAEEKAKEEAKAAAEEAKKAKAKEEAKAKALKEAEEAKASKSKVVANAKTTKSKSNSKTQVKTSYTDKGDDLTKVKGIGKAYMEKLNSEGIFSYEDVATMSNAQIQMMEEKYSFKGDFKESVADAKKLLKAKAK